MCLPLNFSDYNRVLHVDIDSVRRSVQQWGKQ